CRRHPAVSPCLSFNDTAPTYSSPLSLHDALPILGTPPCSNEYVHGMWKRNEGRIIQAWAAVEPAKGEIAIRQARQAIQEFGMIRSEEHTSELQSRENLVCRLLLEKKKTANKSSHQ